jgi:TRAP-type transport system periplasmic protein
MKIANSTIYAAALVVGIGVTGEAWAQRALTLTMGMSEAPETPSHLAAQRIADLVEERSDGRLRIDVFPGGALGSVASMIEGVTTGTVDLYWGGISWYEKFHPDFKIFSIGWGFLDEDHMLRFMETETFEEMKEELRQSRNLRMISHHGLRSPRLLLSKVPVHSPEDLQGVRVRVPDQPIYLRTWEAVGASPVRIDYGEVYLALRQGIADAMENPIEGLHGMAFYEVADHVIYTNHLLNPYAVVVNEQRFQSLDEDLKEILVQSALDGSAYYVEIRDELEAEAKKEMEEAGTQFIEVDLRPFMEKTRVLAQELEAEGEWSEGLFDYVQSFAD